MLHKETFDEAWERVLSMKNSNPDERRLKEVKKAMENRLIRIEDERRKLSKDIKVTKQSIEKYSEIASKVDRI